MKKNILVFALMLLFTGFYVYAAQGDGFITGPVAEDNPNNGSVSVPVTFDISGGADSQTYWEIGFTSDTEVDANTSVNKLSSITLDYGTGADASRGVPTEESVGVYWIIKGNPKLKISLGTKVDDKSGHMESDSGDKINWQISFDSKTIGALDPYATNQNAVYESQLVHEWTKNATIDTGVSPLTIKTQDIETANAASYEGTLVLTIEPYEETT